MPLDTEQTETSEEPRRKRSAAYGRNETLTARKAVASTQAKLADWHRQVAHLRAMVLRKAGDEHAASQAAAALLPLVIAERIEMQGRLEGQDEKVRSHSMVRDVMRALEHLRDQLEEIEHGDAGTRTH